jgi:hypothetical protein
MFNCGLCRGLTKVTGLPDWVVQSKQLSTATQTCKDLIRETALRPLGSKLTMAFTAYVP